MGEGQHCYGLSSGGVQGSARGGEAGQQCPADARLRARRGGAGARGSGRPAAACGAALASALRRRQGSEIGRAHV